MKQSLESLANEVERNGIEMEDVMNTATKTSKRPQTQNAGASLERQEWMDKCESMERAITAGEYVSPEAVVAEFQKFGKDRTKRNDKTPGGLGKPGKVGKNKAK